MPMEKNEKRLVAVLEELEKLTKKQLSFKFAFVKGVVYGLGTVVGATILIAVLSTLAVWIFGEGTSLAELLRGR